MSGKSETSVDFGTDRSRRLAASIAEWMPAIRANLKDIYANPWSNAHPENREVGIALAAGPSVLKNWKQLKGRDVLVCCADKSAMLFGHHLKHFYSASSDQTSAVAHFYEEMPPPRAAVLSAFIHPNVVKTVVKRGFKHYYYLPALFDDLECPNCHAKYPDIEMKLLNCLLNELTHSPLVYGVSDAGSLAFRVLTGLGCKEIGLVGFDYGELGDTPFEQWTLYSHYEREMKLQNKTAEEIQKWGGVRRLKHSKYGTEYITDSSWDHYRTRLNTLISAAKRQGITTINCTQGGSIDFPDLQCMTLAEFLQRKPHG